MLDLHKHSKHVKNQFFDSEELNCIVRSSFPLQAYIRLIYLLLRQLGKFCAECPSYDFLSLQTDALVHLAIKPAVFLLVCSAIMHHYDGLVFQVLSSLGRSHLQKPTLGPEFDAIAWFLKMYPFFYSNFNDRTYAYILFWKTKADVDWDLFCLSDQGNFFANRTILENPALWKFFMEYSCGLEFALTLSMSNNSPSAPVFTALFYLYCGYFLPELECRSFFEQVLDKILANPNAILPSEFYFFSFPPEELMDPCGLYCVPKSGENSARSLFLLLLTSGKNLQACTLTALVNTLTRVKVVRPFCLPENKFFRRQLNVSLQELNLVLLDSSLLEFFQSLLIDVATTPSEYLVGFSSDASFFFDNESEGYELTFDSTDTPPKAFSGDTFSIWETLKPEVPFCLKFLFNFGPNFLRKLPYNSTLRNSGRISKKVIWPTFPTYLLTWRNCNLIKKHQNYRNRILILFTLESWNSNFRVHFN